MTSSGCPDRGHACWSTPPPAAADCNWFLIDRPWKESESWLKSNAHAQRYKSYAIPAYTFISFTIEAHTTCFVSPRLLHSASFLFFSILLYSSFVSMHRSKKKMNAHIIAPSHCTAATRKRQGSLDDCCQYRFSGVMSLVWCHEAPTATAFTNCNQQFCLLYVYIAVVYVVMLIDIMIMRIKGHCCNSPRTFIA